MTPRIEQIAQSGNSCCLASDFKHRHQLSQFCNLGHPQVRTSRGLHQFPSVQHGNA
jgi:hypothetical protein